MEYLAVVIITKNEERNIEKCIVAAQKIADEIIVVDSYSTDKTEEICASLNVTFIKQEWLGYSGQKNFANTKTRHQYILSIDADEVISDELAQSILEEKEKGFPRQAYECNRLTFFCGKPVRHCGWNNDHRIRLWKKDLAQWEGEIHELLHFSTPTEPGFLKGDLLHYSFHSIEQHVDQVNKFSSLSALKKMKKGAKSSLIKIIFLPLFRFIRMYVFQLGFLDGYTGLMVCSDSAYAVFLKYAKLYYLQKRQ